MQGSWRRREVLDRALVATVLAVVTVLVVPATGESATGDPPQVVHAPVLVTPYGPTMSITASGRCASPAAP